MSLFVSLRSEMRKTKRSATLYITIIAAAIIPVIFLLDVSLGDLSPETKKDPLNAIYKLGFEMLYIAILPMFVIALCTLLPQIEYRNNAWKQVLASPQTKVTIYAAKFLQVHLFILFMLLCFNVFLALVITAAHFIYPELHLLQQPFNGYSLVNYNVNLYVSILAISTIQFWMGMRFKNFIVPMAIGFALWLVGIMMLIAFEIPHADLFPYTYPAYSIFPQFKPQVNTIQLYAAGYTALFLVLGFASFKTRNVKA